MSILAKGQKMCQYCGSTTINRADSNKFRTCSLCKRMKGNLKNWAFIEHIRQIDKDTADGAWIDTWQRFQPSFVLAPYCSQVATVSHWEKIKAWFINFARKG